jgi:hypothetical protein
MPALMVTPERLMPGSSARICAPPTIAACFQPSLPVIRRSETSSVGAEFVDGRVPGPAASAAAALQPLGAVEHQAVEGEEGRRDLGGSQRVLEHLVQGEPDQADRDGGHDQQPGQLLVHGLDPALDDGADQAADDPHPVAPEVDDQRQRGGQVQADQHVQVGGAGGGDVEVPLPGAADQGGHQDAVAEAGDGEKLSDALEQADADRFWIREDGHRRPSADREFKHWAVRKVLQGCRPPAAGRPLFTARTLRIHRNLRPPWGGRRFR